MTARRMAAIALGAFALLLVARPPRPTGWYQDDPRAPRSALERARRARDAATDSLNALDRSIWAGHMRDSVARTLATIPPAARNQVMTDARIPATVRQHMQLVYAQSRPRMATAALAVPVFVTIDSAGDYQVGTRVWLEPSQAGVPACALIARVYASKGTIADETKLRRSIYKSLSPSFPQPRHLGLCGFEAAFGAPSPAIREWLRQREFRPVASGYDPALPPRDRNDFDMGYLSIPWWSSDDNAGRALNLRACAAGKLAFCLPAVAPALERLPVDGDNYYGNFSRYYWWGWRGTQDVMNGLAISLGPQKFAELWHGTEAPPDAYRRLTGVGMDSLARRLLLGNTKSLRAGAAPTVGEVIAALLIAAVFAGLSTLSHPRRRA